MVSPREILRLTCRFSPSAVSRSALIVHSCSPNGTQLSGSPISSASAELPASTSPIDRISVLLPTPLSPSSSVHFRVTPGEISSDSTSDRMQRTLVSSTRVRNMRRIIDPERPTPRRPGERSLRSAPQALAHRPRSATRSSGRRSARARAASRGRGTSSIGPSA